jgi:hypothetical protein
MFGPSTIFAKHLSIISQMILDVESQDCKYNKNFQNVNSNRLQLKTVYFLTLNDHQVMLGIKWRVFAFNSSQLSLQDTIFRFHLANLTSEISTILFDISRHLHHVFYSTESRNGPSRISNLHNYFNYPETMISLWCHFALVSDGTRSPS